MGGRVRTTRCAIAGATCPLALRWRGAVADLGTVPGVATRAAPAGAGRTAECGPEAGVAALGDGAPIRSGRAGAATGIATGSGTRSPGAAAGAARKSTG